MSEGGELRGGESGGYVGVGVSGEGRGIIYRLDIKSYELQYFTNLFGSFFLSAPLVPRFVVGCVFFLLLFL